MARRGALRALLAFALLPASLAPLRADDPGAGGSRGQSGAEGTSTSIARAWLSEARAHAEGGSWAAALELAREAAALAPADSDVRFFAAAAGSRVGAARAELLAGLEAAVAAASFRDFAPRDALLLEAELLTLSRRWNDALRALSAIPGRTDDDSAATRIRARATAGAGDRAAFLDLIERALRRFPDDPAFPRLFLERLGPRPISDRERDVAGLVLAAAKRCATADPELPVLAVPLMQDPAARRDAVLAFRAAGGTSALATSRALEYGVIGEAAAAAEFFRGSYPATAQVFRELYALAGGPPGRAELLRAFAAWSGELGVDRDGDGIAEETTVYAVGAPSAWRRDADQDGDAETLIDFAEGLPSAATIRAAGADLRVSYGDYPYVAQAAFASRDPGDGERRAYSFAPGALFFEPLSFDRLTDGAAPAAVLVVPRPETIPTETACSAAALSVLRSRGDDSSLVRLEGGRPLSRQDFLRGRLVSELSYARGSPDRERTDADGDGRFETERTYQGGTPVASRADADGDGLFEYSEGLVFPFLKEWDFDADGRVDARQYAEADGTVRRDFSSRLDGTFDESIALRAGGVAAVWRDGVRLPLVQDADPRVQWIGGKPFELGADRPKGEGVFVRGGTRYRVVLVGDRAFAEVLP